MNNKCKRLKSDGGYGRRIDAYSDRTEELKKQFLRDAAGVLKEVGAHLPRRGLTKMEIRANAAGIGVSGDVYADYWRPDDPTRRAYVTIGASALGWGREDGVIIMARLQFYRPENHRSGEPRYRMADSGPNQWLSANLNSLELADRLWQIFDPVSSPAVMNAFTASGQQAIPGPFVCNTEEAAAWESGMRAVQWAFAEDNASSLTVLPASVSIQLGLFNELERQEADAPAGQ